MAGNAVQGAELTGFQQKRPKPPLAASDWDQANLTVSAVVPAVSDSNESCEIERRK